MTNAAQHESPVVTALCSRKKLFALPSEHFFPLFLKGAILSNLLFVVLNFYNKMVSGHIHSVLIYMTKWLLKYVKSWGAPTAYCEGRWL